MTAVAPGARRFFNARIEDAWRARRRR